MCIRDRFLPVPPQQSQQVVEQVEEVQIERQRAQDTQFAHEFRALSLDLRIGRHTGDLLNVIGRQTGEDQDAQDADSQIERAAAQKDVHDECDRGRFFRE